MPIYVARNEKGHVTEYIILAKKKIFLLFIGQITEEKPINLVSGNFQYRYTFLEKRNQKKSLEKKYKEQPIIAVNGTEHTVRTTGKETFHQKLISTPLNFQRSPKKDVWAGGKCVSASEKSKKVEKGTISASKSKFQKVESDEDDNNFECYKISDGKRVHVDIHKDVTKRRPALASQPNKSEEEEINIKGETMEWPRTVILVYAGQTKHLNHRTG